MLFASFKYHISPSFPSTRIEELKHVLDHNGAHEASGEAWLNEVNLVVSNSMKFEGWEGVKERNESRKLGQEGEEEKEQVYIVTDKWVDRSLVLGKTQSPHHYSPDPSLIFSGIIACATSLPPSDLEVLSAGITALGGQWRTGLTKDVTHLFAMSPDSQKYATAMHFREETGIKVILPHWFDDVVRLGMGGLSTDVYEWPDPELLKNPLGVGGGGGGRGQELSGVKKNMYAMAALFTAPMHDSSSPPLKDLELATAAGSRTEADVWKGKKIVLSRTLQLFQGRREAVQIGIERAGGVVVRYDGDEEIDEDFGRQGETSKREKERRKHEADKILESDVLVTRWRDGAAYVAALRSHNTIGTLAWLFHVQSTGTLTRPLDQLLHYPVPKRPIEAFSNHVITVTNYTGEAREYLKKLIIAMGAKFTPSMSGQNTVLIAAYITGTKATKAQSWSIPIVNHTWLEDCFVQWRNLTVGLEKYIGFPTGVDFSRLLGVRGVGGIAEILEEGLEEEAGGEAPGGTDASVREVQGLIVSEDVDMAVRGEEADPVDVMMMDVDGEGERTPTKQTYKKPSTSKHMVNGQDTSPAPVSIHTPSHISSGNAAEESEGEEEEEAMNTNGKKNRRMNNRVSSPEEDEEEEEETKKQTHIRKQTQKQKTTKKHNRLASSSEDEIEEDGDGNEVVSSKIVKVNSKQKDQMQKLKERARLYSKKSKDEDDSEIEVVSSKITKADLNGKGKGKTAVRSKKSADEDMEVVVEEEEEDEEEEEEEEVASRTKSKKMNSKEKRKVQPRSTQSKSKSRGQDADAMDEDNLEEKDEEEEREEENPKSKGKAGNKRKFVDDDEEDDEGAKDSPAISKSKPKTMAKVTTPAKYTSPTKPTISSKLTTPAKPKSKVLASGDPEDGSEDEMAIALPRVTKLIGRVSGVVPDVILDKQTSLSDEEVGKKQKGREEEEEDVEREEKAKRRPSLIDRNQAKKGDARTRVRKRKVEIVEAEAQSEDNDEEKEPVEPVKSTSKGKMKAKSASAKKKSHVHVQPSDDDDDEDDDDDKPQQQPSKTSTKKSVKGSMNTKSTKAKPTSEEELEDVQQPSDSDSDLPAAPFLSFINKNKGKRVSTDGPISKSKKPVPSTSASAPAAKSKSKSAAKSKSNANTRAMVESEDEDDVNVGRSIPSTPKRSVSVLMPSFNLSGNKKKGGGGGASASVKEVEKGRKGKKAKLSVSSDEDEDEEGDKERAVRVSPRNHAITRTESIRVMSSHQVQVSVKHPGAAASSPASALVKQNTKAIASKSKSKDKSTPMDIDSPSPPPAAPTTSTKTKSPSKTKPISPILKRSAAAKATQRLRDTVMPDLVQFESQMKRANAKGRKSGGMSAFRVEGEDEGGKAGKRSQDGEEERVTKRRRVDDDDNVDESESVSVGAKGKGKIKVPENDEEGEEEDGAKKRTSTKGKGKATVVFVSDEDQDAEDEDNVVVSSSRGGVGAKTKHKGIEKETPSKSGVVLLTTQVTLSDEVIRALTKLGVKITSRPSECTHLLAPQLVRTEKFLCALVVAPFILTEKWAIRSAAVKKLLPEKGFALHDITGENKYGVDLTQSLRRAKELGGKLLAGQTFYVTPKVPVDIKLLKNVVIACGGQVTTQQPTVRIISASPQNRHVISCKEDITIWRPIAAHGIPIYSQELLLTGVLKQELDWDADGVRVDID